MSDPNLKDALSQLEQSLGPLRAMASAGRAAVPPLGPLAPSPILDGNGAPTPARTTPFRTPAAPPPPPERENPFMPPPPPAPVPPLKPLWTNGPEGAAPVERLSTDGVSRVAYETSRTTDACGGPIWERVPLALSPEAETKIAQHLGLGPHLAEALTVLRTVAIGAGSDAQKLALAHNFLASYGLLNGPVHRLTEKTPATLPLQAGDVVAGNVVVVSHERCALLVVTCPARPKVGDLFEQGDYRGTIVRVLAKDQGYDIVVEGHGKPREGAWELRRPSPPASPPAPVDARSE